MQYKVIIVNLFRVKHITDIREPFKLNVIHLEKFCEEISWFQALEMLILIEI